MPDPPPTGADAPAETEDRSRLRSGGLALVRMLLAGVCAVGIGGLVYWAAPDRLTQTDGLVGFPAFYDFNFHPMFLLHRLVVWVGPAVAAALYVVLTRFGPLSAPVPGRVVPLVVADAQASDEPTPLWTLARMLPTALVLAVGFSVAGSVVSPRLAWSGSVAAAMYLGGVWGAGRLARGQRPTAVAVTAVDVFVAPTACLLGVYAFIRYAGTVAGSGVVRTWEWLPWWVFVAGSLAIAAWVLSSRRRGRPDVWVHRRLVAIVAGGSIVYLMTARMPGGIGRIQGFDDSHSVVGADLFTRGYFPWRDVMFLHGVFEDALRTNLSFSLFEHSYWGSLAGAGMVWVPLVWLGYWTLLVWAAPDRWLLRVGFIAVLPTLSTIVEAAVRWWALGFLLVLVGCALRSPRPRPTALMTTALFLAAVSVPEMSYLVLATAAVLVVADLNNDTAGAGWWQRLGRTRAFVIAGAVLTVVWCGYLAFERSLGAWVDYYLIVGPGHAASGAVPRGAFPLGHYFSYFVAVEVVTSLAMLGVLLALFRRRQFDAVAGVAATSVLVTALYAEKALGRLDPSHIVQVLTVAMTMVVLLVVLVVRRGSVAASALARRRPRLAARSTVATAVAVALLLGLEVPHHFHSPTAWKAVDRAPGNARAAVWRQDGNPRLVGYVKKDGQEMTMVADLRRLLVSLRPTGGKVYDFTNSPGYFTYLLQEALASKFYTVGVALPEIAQRQLLADLKRSRPSVVVFDDLYYGLPAWDGPRNESRHYLVSPYLLHGWTPVVNAYGFLFMVRNDLVGSLPRLPRLREPVLTQGLDFSMPACDWGYIPSFIPTQPAGRSVRLPVGDFHSTRRVEVRGWTGSGTRSVVATVDGRVIRSSVGGLPHADVMRDGASELATGFSLSTLTRLPGRVQLFALNAAGEALPLSGGTADLPRIIVGPRGFRARTVASPGDGGLDHVEVSRSRIAQIRVPAGVDLQRYDLMTLVAGRGDLGRSRITMFDSSPGSVPISRDIDLSVLPDAGRSAAVRVGACLQWRGFTGRKVFLSQTGGSPVTSVRLSGIADAP